MLGVPEGQGGQSSGSWGRLWFEIMKEADNCALAYGGKGTESCYSFRKGKRILG
jgi:hypothetical protein